MRIPIAHMPPVIPVGVQTESGVEDIGVDVSPWLEKWPGMIVAVWLTRPGETSAYPAGNVQMDGNVLIWRPDGYDTAIPGSGKMEILGLTQDGEKRKLTGDGVATMIRSTTLASTAEPGVAEKPWVDKVLDAAQRAEDAADRAQGAGGGTVTPEQVQEAVNEALQNAKDSGEFDGHPGVSATHEWNGTVLTITSASGTSSSDLKGKQGEPGKTPVKGEEYWTEADKTEIVNDVLEQMPDGSGGGESPFVLYVDHTIEEEDISVIGFDVSTASDIMIYIEMQAAEATGNILVQVYEQYDASTDKVVGQISYLLITNAIGTTKRYASHFLTKTHGINRPETWQGTVNNTTAVEVMTHNLLRQHLFANMQYVKITRINGTFPAGGRITIYRREAVQ